ncbi:oligosaccharide flippase family protein [Cryobacterium sp. SO2]|uniref:oligosaccharide flippase family protein n=1 Tax=Cryobacterium sp. SO2 TaxID=1897060 RepID=UPI00223DC5B7|nr:oligosaccharide flippase family protein [Cryobacterium sp. SO2]WEO77986.1 oligosaccharide flippase family protein [Cryobacterium sp. SO2]
MTTTFDVARRGAGWTLTAQVVVGLGQIVYSGFTARIFTPAEFGGFAAALSLQGILMLLANTGLPSVVMKERELSKRDVGRVRIYGLVGGLMAAAGYLLVSPVWLVALNAPSGTEFVPLLAVALVLAPIASIESAMLRREGRPFADSMVIVAAFVVPSVAGVCVAYTWREAWALALVTALYPVTLGVGAALSRRVRYTSSGGSAQRTLLSFATTVSAQNLVFLVLGQLPGWAVSAVLGSASLGHYSRAGTLAGIPSTSLAGALSRAVQPHWRKLVDEQTTAKAIRDTAILTSSLALPMFATLVVLGPSLTTVWLGPGWEEAAQIVPWLAASYGLQVPFTVLANSLEMRGHFGPVRAAQLGLGAGLSVGLAFFLLTENVQVAAAATVLSQGCGLLALLLAMARTSFVARRRLLSAVVVPLAWAALIGVVGLGGVTAAQTLGLSIAGSSDVASVLVGGLAAALVWLATIRWQPVSRVLAERGIRLPTPLRSAATR